MSLHHQLLQCLFWASLGLIVYTYAGYPLWIYSRSWLRPNLWHQSPIVPSVSVILAVHNGAEILREKIDHLLALDYPKDKVEIIVASDGSTDGTNLILEELHHSRVKTIICPEHRGKVAALNAGIESATGELLLFVDARPWLATDALRRLASNFADPKVGCAAGLLTLRENGQDAGMKAVTGLYWGFEQSLRNREARIDSCIGVYGGFYAARRELVKRLPEGTILDDLMQCMSIIRQGYRCVSDERAHVYDRWPKTSRNEFNRKVRTLAGNFQLLQLAPWVLSSQNRLRFEFIAHKVLRLLVPALLMVLLVTSAFLASQSLLFKMAFAAQIVLYLLGAIGSLAVPGLQRIAGPANAFCMLNIAVIVGFWKFLFNRTALWKIWVPIGVSSAAQSEQQAQVAAHVSSAT
jgi:cellulose synthase/poly-beta-1,6-N-acetylglucosamine synthase-like glycosyltransferase